MDTGARWIVVIPAHAPARVAGRLLTAGLLGMVTGSLNAGLLAADTNVSLNDKIKVPRVCNLCGTNPGTKHSDTRRDVTFSDFGSIVGGTLLGQAKVDFRVPVCDACAKLPAAPGVSLQTYGKRGEHWEVVLLVSSGAVAALYADANPGSVVTPGAVVTETAPAPVRGPAASQRSLRVVPGPAGWAVEVDGVAGRPYEAILKNSLATSPDGRRVAYAAKAGEKWRIVVDGVEGPPYDDVLNLVPVISFSPDGQRIAYAAGRNGVQTVVVDGAEYPACDGLSPGSLRFSRDSRRFAYGAKTGARWTVVADGTPGPAWDGISTDSLAFSPDGARLAFGARIGAGWAIVLNGIPGALYQGLLNLEPIVLFSPDGKQVAYGVRKDAGTVTVIVNGFEHGPCVTIKKGTLAFSADSQQVSYQAQTRGRPAGDWTMITTQVPTLAAA